MDVISSLGLVGTTFKITDFLCCLLTDTRKIYQSGRVDKFENLESLMGKLTQFNHDISTSIVSKQHQRADQAAKNIAHLCQDVINKLLGILNDLKLRDRRVWESFRVAMKATMKQNDIDRLCSDLHQIQIILVAYTQSHILSVIPGARLSEFYRDQTDHRFATYRAEQSELKMALHAIEQRSRKWEMPPEKSLYSMLDKMQTTIESLEADQDSVSGILKCSNCGTSQEGFGVLHDVSERMKFMSETLIGFTHRTSRVQSSQSVLQSLFFQEMLDRQEGVAASHSGTSEWIYENRCKTTTPDWIFKDETPGGVQIQFSQWLEQNGGIYWIRGKAGSGKSTIMKFIVGHDTTVHKLSCWANGNRLVLGSHFFWASGSQLQRSQQGLFRTLLFTILRACPDLIPMALTAVHNFAGDTHPWKVSELLGAMRSLAKAQLSVNFALFIDGLDEFEAIMTN